MTKRSDLPPPRSLEAMRRIDARSEVSERVTLRAVGPDGRAMGEPLDGWTLNLSRGGVRAIVEVRAAIGDEFDVVFAQSEQIVRRGRVAWTQEEPDGTILGLEFVTGSGTQKSVPPAASTEPEPTDPT